MQNFFVKNNEGNLEDLTTANSLKNGQKNDLCTKFFTVKFQSTQCVAMEIQLFWLSENIVST